MLKEMSGFTGEYKGEWFNYPWYYNEIALNVITKKWRKFIELGTWRGHSICHLCFEIKKHTDDNIEIYTVDTFKPTSTSASCTPSNLKDICYKNIQRMGMENTIKVLECTSHEASLKFEDGYFDFVFIDADHVYERIKEDINDWLPKVKKGGIISGHDYAGEVNGVKKAVDEKFGNNKILKNVGIWEVAVK